MCLEIPNVGKENEREKSGSGRDRVRLMERGAACSEALGESARW